MWSRLELKDRAKESLKRNYWKGFLVTLLVTFLASGGGGFSSFSNFLSGNTTADWKSFIEGFQEGIQQGSSSAYSSTVTDRDIVLIMVIIVIVFFAILVAFAISTLLYLFLIGPFTVASSKYFIGAKTDAGDLNNILFPFKKGRYAATVKAMGWQYLFIALWSLLFFIPGIIKSYSYSMVPYLMADNPDLDYKSAIKLSMHMTNGQKWRMFVLDLSFIGWAILGVLALFIGLYFLLPYYYATKAELYIVLKNKAIEEGVIVTYQPLLTV